MKIKLYTSIIILLFTMLPYSTFAQIPFGGRIVGMHECACSGGWMIYVADTYSKMVVPMVFQFGVSRLNANYNIFSPGVQTLGSYTPGGICLMAKLECFSSPIPPFGTITPFPLSGIGTSLTP